MPGHTVTLAREIAYDAFLAVMHNKQTPDETLDEFYTRFDKNLKRLDKNFAKEIVYGSLRWYSKIFWILQKTSSRDLAGTHPAVQTALVCGTYQIFYMDRVPDRAAVNESVEYVRKKGQASACSFVNGILRQIARRAEYFAKPDKVTQSVDYLALQFAHPRWIVERWHRMFKFDRMEVILASNNVPPPISVRINSMKTPIKEILTLQQSLLKEEHTHSDRRSLRSCLHLKEFPRFDAESLFGQGFYTIQDEASQLIGYLVEPKENELLIDACAGPGGKLSHIYELAEGKLRLFAVEKHPVQMAKAQETMARMGHANVTWVAQDFLEWTAPEKADRILLDAPCSGLGVLRRHPEGKWQKSHDIVSEMSQLQKRLLAHAIKNLRVGGELIYSVCSFEPEETVQQAAWLMEQFKDKIEMVSPVSRLPDYYKRYVTRENVLLIYSGNQDEMDGFGAFIVRLKTEVS